MRRLWAAPLVTALALWWTVSSTAASTACPPLDYLAGIAQAQAALDTTPPDTGATATVVERLSRTYPAVRPTLSDVLAQLQATPPGAARARARLDTIARTLALPRGSTCNADQRPARSALDGVYRSSVFANLDQKPPGPNPIGQFLSWLSSLLRGLTGALGPAGSIALGAALLAGALALAAWRLRGVLGSRPARIVTAEETGGADPEREW
ncbi:MAG TPA: hypothetical protein VF155_11575, partial [Candidatus Dormibacteraeota bacterium]